MPLNYADEKRIDAYIASCSQEELETFREEVARKREEHWKNLGDIIRRSNPRTNPDIRAYILSKLPGATPAPLMDQARTRLMEAQVMQSAEEAGVLQPAIARILDKQPADLLAHWLARGIDPIDVPNIRSLVVKNLLDAEAS